MLNIGEKTSWSAIISPSSGYQTLFLEGVFDYFDFNKAAKKVKDAYEQFQAIFEHTTVSKLSRSVLEQFSRLTALLKSHNIEDAVESKNSEDKKSDNSFETPTGWVAPTAGEGGGGGASAQHQPAAGGDEDCLNLNRIIADNKTEVVTNVHSFENFVFQDPGSGEKLELQHFQPFGSNQNLFQLLQRLKLKDIEKQAINKLPGHEFVVVNNKGGRYWFSPKFPRDYSALHSDRVYSFVFSACGYTELSYPPGAKKIQLGIRRDGVEADGGAAAQQVGTVGFVEDFTPDQLKIFEPRMYATNGPGSNWGILSKSGFLGDGESLKERVAADLNTCRELGTSPEELIAKLLSAIGDKQRFDMTPTSSYCSQACPFSLVDSVEKENPSGPVKDACHYSSTNIEIRNRRTGKTMQLSGLALHLVEAHHFFEGNVQYRIDVRELNQLLEHADNDGIP